MRTFKTLALLVALAACFPASALASCGSAANREPGSSSLRSARAATLCLLNHERHVHHLHSLRFNQRLALAGLRHARDMVHKKYFSHGEPSGHNFVQRIMRTHYVPASSRWFLGENLAWGGHLQSTPREIVHAWMASPAHRRNILTPGFREIGIALVPGAPVVGVSHAATYATEFGVIHRR